MFPLPIPIYIYFQNGFYWRMSLNPKPQSVGYLVEFLVELALVANSDVQRDVSAHLKDQYFNIYKVTIEANFVFENVIHANQGW